MPDPTTFEDAWSILERYRIKEDVPSSVREHLKAGLEGCIQDTPKPGDRVFERVQNVVVGSNRLAARAAAEKARELGLTHCY